jgi:dehydrogenase/reductase SDR family member 7B
MIRYPLRDKVALITGGTEGIGAACADAFHNRGAHVVALGLPSEAAGNGNGVPMVYGDITRPETRDRLINTAIREFGRVDILVNNVGVGLYATASETPLEYARRIFEVNFFSALSMTQLVLPLLRRQSSGAVVNIGSIGGCVSLPWAAMYSATKRAMHSFSDSLYRELRPEGIHVLTVVPGIVTTRFRENVLAGTPPPRVRNTGFAISAPALAKAVAEGLEKRRRVVTMPWLCHPFDFIDRWLPRVMDVYCEHKLRS